ncbi:MAG: YgfZ/GcvT domain-containing protein [Burkholderiaceae bacterium]
MFAPLDGVAALSHLGVIRVTGEDAARFIHGQLTQDFALLDLQHARLAGYLSAKGRMLASLVGFKRNPDDILLVCHRDLATSTAKRLTMFVLRAKAQVRDESDQWSLHGLAGGAVPGGPQPPWTLVRLGEASIVHLYPADGTPLALHVAPAGSPLPAGAALDAAVWAWAEVRSGVATVSPAVADQFVPQMLNYESVGGVSFKKGCYPGQEVVARSQFRGAIKRRTYRALAPAVLPAGTEVFSPADPQQPCGLVVQAAAAPQGGAALLVSLQIAAAEGPLYAGAAPGTPLQLDSLPYPLLEDL